MTSRLLKTRIDKYKAAVKRAKCDVSAVAEHVHCMGQKNIRWTLSLLPFLRMRWTYTNVYHWSLGLPRGIATFKREKGTLVLV